VNAPTYMTRDEFLAVLDDIRDRVLRGDSMEGYVSWEIPWHHAMGDAETDPEGDGFRVQAGYRIGNLQGQGGMRLIGEMQ